MDSYRVLVVDDEEMVRDLVFSLLSKNGHTCEVAKDGIEALEKIKKDSFDAVVSDIVLPHMNGITLTEELLRAHSNIPVMLMTGHSHKYSAESVVAAGAREFIKKPFSIQEFIIRFDKMMRHHKEAESLLALSLIDELTGLYNRRRFFILAERYLQVAGRIEKRLLLLFIDMDNLKWINDYHGHSEGDQALKDLANILRETFRESDIIARIGGDEFVVLSESSDEKGEIVLSRLYENIKDHKTKESRCYTLSISVGTTQFDPKYPLSIDELLSKADALMYAQKRGKWKKTFFQTLASSHFLIPIRLYQINKLQRREKRASS